MVDKSKRPTLRWEAAAYRDGFRGEMRPRFRASHFSPGRTRFVRPFLVACPIFPRRNASDWYFRFSLAAPEFSLFMGERSRLVVIFRAGHFGRSVNLRNLCRCVSFGFGGESPGTSRRGGYLRLFTERSIDVSYLVKYLTFVSLTDNSID